MSKPAIVITRELKPEHVAQIQAVAPGYQLYTQWEHPVPDAALADVEIILGGDGPLTHRILNTPKSRLKFVAAHSAGIDYLNLAELQSHHVLLSNASGLHTEWIAEYVIGAILRRVRALDEAEVAQREHRWQHQVDYSGLAEKQVLIVGAGRVGSQLATLLQAFGAHTIGVNRKGRALAGFDRMVATADIASVLGRADIIVDLLPLTPETAGFFDADKFAAMKAGVQFINCGRGKTVVTAALIQAVKNGQIGSTVLDVFEAEPLPADSPLWDLPNTLITSHIAGQVPHFKTVITKLYLENLQAYLKTGQLATHVVDYANGF
jgi:phosphoglycerate dehydrogenase-like enzyme